VAREFPPDFSADQFADLQLFLFAAAVVGAVGEPHGIDFHLRVGVGSDSDGAFEDAALLDRVEQFG